MVAITPELMGNSLVFSLISSIVILIFSLYQLYLNYKQAQVKNQMAELLEEVKAIRNKVAPKK